MNALGRVDTSADGREDRNLVAVLQDIAARAVLLIDGNGGGVKRGRVGETLAAEDREKIVDRSAGSEIAPVCACRDDRFEGAKGKQAHADCSRTHTVRILSRPDLAARDGL